MFLKPNKINHCNEIEKKLQWNCNCIAMKLRKNCNGIAMLFLAKNK